jgi:exodeoxyribonuclease VII small subunit
MSQRTPAQPGETPASSAGGADPAAGKANGPSFEVAIKRLTEIVQQLERGEIPLEESLRLFEEGVKLSRVSQQRLDSAEKRVEQLLAVDEQGQARTAPFATDAQDGPREDGDE